MTVSLRLILLILAFVLFFLAGIGITHPRINLIGLGLACWVFAAALTTAP